MVFHTEHDCAMDCKRLVTYVRIEGKWTKIGHFGTECKQFEPLDLAKEEEERLHKERLLELQLKTKQLKQESREAITQIRQDNATANLFGVKIKSFCPSNDDVTP